MLKILQARLQQYMNWEFPDVQAVFRKGRGTKDQIANIHWIIEKAREFHKNIYFCFIYYAKALTVWITTNSGKFLKRWEYQTMLPVSSGTEWQKLKIGKGKEAVRHPGGGNGHYEERLKWPVRRKTGEFLGGPVVKNPPFNARDMGSIPGQGTKILHRKWKKRKWSLSVISNSATPWTVAYQAPPSMEFSRQEYWTGLSFPSPGIFLTQGLKPGLPYCR